jgi:hypothetical protein
VKTIETEQQLAKSTMSSTSDAILPVGVG